ncbi:hypothetical protein [Pseudomonas mandelii]|uniref:Uncharacterized protein n=1 Tax=Pseudomonas mandelii TaxID=75612 RepID=A0A502HSK8_9PSED|nr:MULTISPECIES: hypothetical protein [Pseudomonas]TPG77767.1 hypothetical protein EAH74_25960 [Pseudomonas mandelii]TPG92436.1 hypothetical protein EAH72_22830 [Pseudomonas caspiana]
MIETLLNADLSPTRLMTIIKTIDITSDINKLVSRVREDTARTHAVSQAAEIMKLTNIHTRTLLLHCNESGNISLKAPDSAPASQLLYTVPGNSILFAINNQSFPVQLYAVQDNHLTLRQQIIVDADNPLFIDGSKVLFDSNPMGTGHTAFIGSINLPDRGADIGVFDRTSLRKIAWFPHDDSAARYLVSLELLEAAQDPEARKVAEELVYHYHPAVAWKAFQLIQQTNPQAALNYVPLLRKLQNSRLNHLLDQQSEAA